MARTSIIAAALALMAAFQPIAAQAHDWLDDVPAAVGIHGCIRTGSSAWRCPDQGPSKFYDGYIHDKPAPQLRSPDEAPAQ